MSTYQHILQAEQQVNDLLQHLDGVTQHSEALVRAKACLTEAFEHMVVCGPRPDRQRRHPF